MSPKNVGKVPRVPGTSVYDYEDHHFVEKFSVESGAGMGRWWGEGGMHTNMGGRGLSLCMIT